MALLCDQHSQMPAPVEPVGNEDPLWAVPIEQLPAGGGSDPAADPDYVPIGYSTSIDPAHITRIEFRPGKLNTGIEVPDLEFHLP